MPFFSLPSNFDTYEVRECWVFLGSILWYICFASVISIPIQLPRMRNRFYTMSNQKYLFFHFKNILFSLSCLRYPTFLISNAFSVFVIFFLFSRFLKCRRESYQFYALIDVRYRVGAEVNTPKLRANSKRGC